MGVKEQPVTNRMKYGKLRRYTCRLCGQAFKDYWLPEKERICPRCHPKPGEEKRQDRGHP